MRIKPLFTDDICVYVYKHTHTHTTADTEDGARLLRGLASLVFLTYDPVPLVLHWGPPLTG